MTEPHHPPEKHRERLSLIANGIRDLLPIALMIVQVLFDVRFPDPSKRLAVEPADELADPRVIALYGSRPISDGGQMRKKPPVQYPVVPHATKITSFVKHPVTFDLTLELPRSAD